MARLTTILNVNEPTGESVIPRKANTIARRQIVTEIKGPRPLCAPTGKRIIGAQVTVTAVREVERIYADAAGHTIAEYGSGITIDPITEKAEMVGPHLVFVDEDGCAYQCVDLVEGPCDDDPPNPNSLH